MAHVTVVTFTEFYNILASIVVHGILSPVFIILRVNYRWPLIPTNSNRP